MAISVQGLISYAGRLKGSSSFISKLNIPTKETEEYVETFSQFASNYFGQDYNINMGTQTSGQYSSYRYNIIKNLYTGNNHAELIRVQTPAEIISLIESIYGSNYSLYIGNEETGTREFISVDSFLALQNKTLGPIARINNDELLYTPILQLYINEAEELGNRSKSTVYTNKFPLLNGTTRESYSILLETFISNSNSSNNFTYDGILNPSWENGNYYFRPDFNWNLNEELEDYGYFSLYNYVNDLPYNNRLDVIVNEQNVYTTYIYDKDLLLYALNKAGFHATYSLVEAESKQEWPEPTPPTPEPTPEPTPTDPNDAIETAPGQEQNVVINTGGTGDKTSDPITRPTTSFSGTGLGNFVYLLNSRQMEKIREDVMVPDIIQSFFSDGASIISLNLWPFVFNTGAPGVNETVGVNLGGFPVIFNDLTTPNCYYFVPTFQGKLDVVDGYVLEPYFGGFLDFEPYTTIKMYAPYVGIVDLNAHDIVGKQVSIFYQIDVNTGKANLHLKSGTDFEYSWPCQMGNSIPFTSSNFGQLQQNLFMKTIGAIGTGITGGAIAGISAGLTAGAEALSSFKYQNNGSTGDQLGRFEPQDVYFIIEHTGTAIPDMYNKIKGRPSMISITLDSLPAGFMTIDSPRLDLSCTEQEKNQIISALQSGVIKK